MPHGFRSSFRDWAAEETDHAREVIEAALAHVVQNKVEESDVAHRVGWLITCNRPSRAVAVWSFPRS